MPQNARDVTSKQTRHCARTRRHRCTVGEITTMVYCRFPKFPGDAHRSETPPQVWFLLIPNFARYRFPIDGLVDVRLTSSTETLRCPFSRVKKVFLLQPSCSSKRCRETDRTQRTLFFFITVKAIFAERKAHCLYI